MKICWFLQAATCLMLIMVGCKHDKTVESPEAIIEKFNEYILEGVANNPVVGVSPEVQHYLRHEIKDSIAVTEAFKTIDRGIEAYPNRLDLRFGKITLANIIMDYALSANTIIETLNYGKNNSTKWLWDGDTPIDDVDVFMKEAIHDYLFEFSTHSEVATADEAIEKVSNAAVEFYPNWVVALNFQAIRIMNYDAEKALKMFNKIIELAPDDPVIMINIGNCYVKLNDNKNAILWYDRALECSDLDDTTKNQISRFKSAIDS